MKKILWIGIILFLLGMITAGVSAWKFSEKEISFQDSSFFSLYNFLPSFSTVPTETILPIPLPQETVKPKTNITFYYDLDCSYCHDITKHALLPFLKAYPNTFEFTILPFSKNNSEKNQNESLLLYCLLQSESSVAVLEKTQDPFDDWKKWRDAQENNDILKTCMNEENSFEEVKKMREQAKTDGIRGTPTLLIDGKKYEGVLSLESLLIATARYIH